LAFALRLAAVFWLSDTVPYTDYAYYHLAGEKIASNWGFFFDRSQVEYYGKFGWWPPLYPFLIGALYAIFGPNPRVVVFVQVALGTLVCWLVYRLGKRLVGERGGCLAAFLVAIDPTYVFATNLLASENLYVVWLTLGLLLVTRQAQGVRTWAATGAMLAFGALTRATALVVPAVIALWLLLRKRWTALPRLAWMLGVCVLLIAPWTLRNALVVGSPALVCFGGGLNFYFGHNPQGIGYRDLSQTPMAGLTTQTAIDRKGYELGWDCIERDPMGFFRRIPPKIAALFGTPRYALHDNSAILLPEGWQSDPARAREAEALRARQRQKNALLDGFFTRLAVVHTWVLLLGALAALLRWRRLPTGAHLMAFLSAAWIAAHLLFWAQPRFRYPMDVLLALLAACAFIAWRRDARTSAPQAI